MPHPQPILSEYLTTPTVYPARLRKSGEGSRGGKILGHTRSGKPIYAKHDDRKAAAKTYDAQDHKDASALHYHTHMMHHAAGQAAEAAMENDGLPPSLHAHFSAKAEQHSRLAAHHEHVSDWHDTRHTAALNAEDEAINGAFAAMNRRHGFAS